MSNDINLQYTGMLRMEMWQSKKKLVVSALVCCILFLTLGTQSQRRSKYATWSACVCVLLQHLSMRSGESALKCFKLQA